MRASGSVAPPPNFVSMEVRMSVRLSGVFSEINPTQLVNPTLAFLKNYWEQKRAGRALPTRADIKPSEMKQHLGWVVLVDALPGFGDFRYRTIGTRLSPYFAPQSTGKPISEVFQPFGEPVVKAMLAPYRKAARDQVVVHAWGAADWMGRAFLDFESIYMPLSDDGVTANMVLSAVTFELAAPLKPQP
jgi:hypothetical protein